MENSKFKILLEEHLKRVQKKLQFSSQTFQQKATEHDQDKIFNPQINKVYEERFEKLKEIPFGTKEYLDYERKHFTEAHSLHGQQRHHFYSKYNKLKDINLFDMIEAIIDISESAKQYGNNELLSSFKSKGLYDYDLEELINNTLLFLEKDDKNNENK